MRRSICPTGQCRRIRIWVTPEGSAAIERELARLEAAQRAVTAADEKRQSPRMQRDLRYWRARRASAQMIERPSDARTVHFGATVTIRRRKQRSRRPHADVPHRRRRRSRASEGHALACVAARPRAIRQGDRSSRRLRRRRSGDFGDQGDTRHRPAIPARGIRRRLLFSFPGGKTWMPGSSPGMTL